MIGVDVGVCVGVGVEVGVLEGVEVCVSFGVMVGVYVAVGIGVTVEVEVCVGVGAIMAVRVAVGAMMNVADEIEGVEVAVEAVVGIGVGVGAIEVIGSVVSAGRGVGVGVALASRGGDVWYGVDVGDCEVTILGGSGVGVAKMMRGALRNSDRHSLFHCWLMSGRVALMARYPRMVRNRIIDVNFHIFNFEGLMPFGVSVGAQRNADTLSNSKVSSLLSVNVQTFHRTIRSKSSSVHRSFRVM